MCVLNLLTKNQVKNIFDIVLDDQINFPNLFRNRTESPSLLRKQHFMLATLNNSHAIFASDHKVVFGNDPQRHANKGAQQMVEHRLAMTHSAMQTRVHNRWWNTAWQ